MIINQFLLLNVALLFQILALFDFIISYISYHVQVKVKCDGLHRNTILLATVRSCHSKCFLVILMKCKTRERKIAMCMDEGKRVCG